MSEQASAITPTIFYRDPIAAMRWLERAFDFETTTLVTDAEGRVGHAQMTFSGAAIGVGGEWAGPQLGGARMASPSSLDGASTQFLWITLASGLDAHCERARQAGAQITQEPEEQFYGARTYRARDPEGHVWCFTQTTRTVSEAEMEKVMGLQFKTSLD